MDTLADPLLPTPPLDHAASVTMSSDTTSNSSARDEAPLTAAELLRRKQKRASQSEPKIDSVDLDDEIRRLEAELQSDSDDSSTSSDSSETDSSNDSQNNNDNDASDKVVCLSKVKDDTIESLPQHLLPSGKRRKIKGFDDEYTKEKKPAIGLEAAVKEILQGYVPRSAEKLPFYCRYCAKQYSTEDDFIAHKQTDFHIKAEEMERKASYCRLCRKQLTSPVQLQEHLKSRPHKEILQKRKQRQLGGKPGYRPNNVQWK
jgi:Zinc-finger of C2H2 type